MADVGLSTKMENLTLSGDGTSYRKDSCDSSPKSLHQTLSIFVKQVNSNSMPCLDDRSADTETFSEKVALRQTKSSTDMFGYENGHAKLKRKPSLVRCDTTLAVPNIFITSYSKSADSVNHYKHKESKFKRTDSEKKLGKLDPKQKRRYGSVESVFTKHRTSVSEDKTQVENNNTELSVPMIKKPLQKSYSDTLCRKQFISRHCDFDHFLSTEAIKTYKSKPKYYEVQNTNIVLGNIELAYHEPLLCKLKVQGVIDLSNLHPDQIPQSKKSNMRCLCGAASCRKPAYFRIAVAENDVKELSLSFSSINKFINGVTEKGNKVALVCYYGFNLTVAAATQYLMHQKRLPLKQALKEVTNEHIEVDISPGVLHVLHEIENEILTKNKDRSNYGSEINNSSKVKYSKLGDKSVVLEKEIPSSNVSIKSLSQTPMESRRRAWND